MKTPSSALLGAYRGHQRRFTADEVVQVRANGNYTLFAVEGREYLANEGIGALSRRLAPLGFVRARRDALVNMEHVVQVHRSGTQLVLRLRSGEEVTVSRRETARVRRHLGPQLPRL